MASVTLCYTFVTKPVTAKYPYFKGLKYDVTIVTGFSSTQKRKKKILFNLCMFILYILGNIHIYVTLPKNLDKSLNMCKLQRNNSCNKTETKV
jgi:hypothetical protein